MSKLRTFIRFAIVAVVLSFGFWVLSYSVSAQQSASSNVSVSIGEYEFKLFGYTSPRAIVTFEGAGVFDQTTARLDGYFEFKNRFSPFSTKEPCLTAQDTVGRLSNQLCLAPFPTDRDITIGPVIMPPTISLSHGQYFVGDEIILSGQTVPNTDVDLSVFTDRPVSAKSFVKSTFAFSLPQLKVKSDTQGSYTLSLPSSQSEAVRLFTQTVFEKESSPKSITLTAHVEPWWKLLLRLLRSRLLELLILAQILLLALYLFRRYLHHDLIHNNRALVLAEKHPLLVKSQITSTK